MHPTAIATPAGPFDPFPSQDGATSNGRWTAQAIRRTVPASELGQTVPNNRHYEDFLGADLPSSSLKSCFVDLLQRVPRPAAAAYRLLLVVMEMIFPASTSESSIDSRITLPVLNHVCWYHKISTAFRSGRQTWSHLQCDLVVDALLQM